MGFEDFGLKCSGFGFGPWKQASSSSGHAGLEALRWKKPQGSTNFFFRHGGARGATHLPPPGVVARRRRDDSHAYMRSAALDCNTYSVLDTATIRNWNV